VREKSSSVLIIVRVLLLALAAVSAVVAFVIARGAEPPKAASAVTYVCPMHPDVTASVPGECSICRMALEPQQSRVAVRVATSAAPDPHEATPGAPSTVAAARYVCPMHPKQTSPKSGQCALCRMPLEPQGAGSASAPDAQAFACSMHPEVTSPVPAKCRKCKMPLQRRDAGHAGAETADEHAGHLEAATSTRAAAVFSFHDVSRVRAHSSSRDMKGPAWLETPTQGRALYFTDECQLLQPGEKGLFFPTARPKDGAPAGIPVQLSAEPATPWDAATALVGFDVEKGVELAPKQTGWLKLATRTRNDLAIPYSAIIQSREGPYVLVLSEDLNKIAKRTVTLGSVVFGYASIIAGLRDGERVAAMRTFSLDALRKQAQQ
jgi:hypothetical protein